MRERAEYREQFLYLDLLSNDLSKQQLWVIANEYKLYLKTALYKTNLRKPENSFKFQTNCYHWSAIAAYLLELQKFFSYLFIYFINKYIFSVGYRIIFSHIRFMQYLNSKYLLEVTYYLIWYWKRVFLSVIVSEKKILNSIFKFHI